MLNIVYYHTKCPDGFASAWALYCKFKQNAFYFPATNKLPFKQIRKYQANTVIYCVDICPSPEELQDWIDNSDVKQIIVIDHHTNIKVKKHKKVTLVHNIHHSGCVLTYKYLYRDPVPEVLLYIEDRDLWNWKLPNSYELNEGIHASYDIKPAGYTKLYENFEQFGNLVATFSTNKQRLLEMGRSIRAMVEEHINRILKSCSKCEFSVGGQTYKCQQVSTILYKSEIGNRLLEADKECDFAICWRFHPQTNKFWLSFRSNDMRTNVQEIAEMLGGGGHRNASSATICIDEFSKYIKC